MIDPKKAEEIARKIADLRQQIERHRSAISRFEREKAVRARDYDRQIEREENAITRLERQISDLERQMR
jgi:chromosome segregation ATPase